jgi:predicted dehydrogenase
VGIIGAGDRGMELVHQIRACSDAEVAGFSDIFSSRLERAAGAAPEAKLARDYRELLDDASIHAVVIATPPHVHAVPFIDALDAGKHVYIEKTLALSVADLKKMRRAYRKDSGKHVIQVGHQACSSGHLNDARMFLSDPSRMGEITSIAMRNFRNAPRGKALWSRPVLIRPTLTGLLSMRIATSTRTDSSIGATTSITPVDRSPNI